jgi:peptidyl-prolyl cis-trans isomerase SurA
LTAIDKPQRMRSWFLAPVLLCLAVWAGASARPAEAQDELKIAAVVNDDVITQLDVYTRLRMAMLSAQLQDTPETRQRLLPTVMRTLIDEHLKSQEAKTQGVTVGNADVDARIDSLAKRNNMSRQDFESMLSNNGVLVSALADQIRADIAWTRLAQRYLRPTIRITDDEISESLARAVAARGKAEYRLSQIFLAIDSPKESATVQQSAQRLLEQLQAGANFPQLATQFSQDTGAANGGALGWVRPDEVDRAVARELTQVGSGPEVKGKLLGPIQGTGGMYLIRIEDVRRGEGSTVAAGTVHLVQLLWPLAPNASDKEIQSAQDQADHFSGKSHSCEEFERLAQDAAPAVFRDFGRIEIDAIPPEIRSYAINQQLGTPTPGIRGDGGIAVFVICDRGGANGQVTRVEIADRLAQERLETLARGYLSDLRRAAYIDIRL